ncbi:K(+)-transporting ATPase subunit F [Actinomycetospora straminea]|uniref:K(+)-transporting ATPase subunit F n=1 Tax=Actinomycetospora straminea TaxID=663607 RepID=UPI003B679580
MPPITRRGEGVKTGPRGVNDASTRPPWAVIARNLDGRRAATARRRDRREPGARPPLRGRGDRGLRGPAARRPRAGPVVIANVVGAVIALGLLIYLAIALLRPEKF